MNSDKSLKRNGFSVINLIHVSYPISIYHFPPPEHHTEQGAPKTMMQPHQSGSSQTPLQTVQLYHKEGFVYGIPRGAMCVIANKVTDSAEDETLFPLERSGHFRALVAYEDLEEIPSTP